MLFKLKKKNYKYLNNHIFLCFYIWVRSWGNPFKNFYNNERFYFLNIL